MPRNSTGTYTLTNSDQVTGNTITASLWNGNFDDIATALTQSLATTGVSTMTGALLGATGSASAPGYTFGSSKTDGLYLAGTHQIGLSTNGTQTVTFNSDQSVTWAGNQSFGGTTSTTGTATFNGAQSFAGNSTFTSANSVTFNATTYTFGAGATAAFWLALAPPVDVGAVIDGGGTTILSTIIAPKAHIPYPLTITKWWVMADQSGSITIDILRANNGVPSASIVGAGTKPNLSSAQFGSSAPSSWTATTLAKDDFLAFSVTGTPSSVTNVSVILTCTRTG